MAKRATKKKRGNPQRKKAGVKKKEQRLARAAPPGAVGSPKERKPAVVDVPALPSAPKRAASSPPPPAPATPKVPKSPLEALRAAPLAPKRATLPPERLRFDTATEGERRALVIVDVQVDFCPGGAIPVPRGDDVVGVLNQWIEKSRAAGERIYATRESIPPGSKHFKEAGGPWLPHCIAGSKGAEFHPTLKLPWDATIVTKGTEGEEDTYSGFLGKTPDGRSLLAELRLRGVTHLFIGGLATDHCVKATALDALKNGFKVTIIKDGIRAVEANPGDGERALQEMRQAGAKLA